MALLDWLRRTFGIRDGIRCSFCDAHQRDVVKLVAGPRGIYQCDACARLAVGVVDSTTAPDDHVLVARWDLLRTLQAIPPPAPRAATRRLVRAAIALSEQDAALLREVAAAAMNVLDHHGALEALGAIPAGDRDAGDRYREAICYGCEAAPAEAARALDGCDLAALDPVEREMARVMRPLYRLRAGETVSDDVDALAAETTAALVAQGTAATLLDSHHRTCAELKGLAAMRRGDLAGAERALRELPVEVEAGPNLHLAMREVALARGDVAEAAAARERALAVLHPDSPTAVRLRAEGKGGPFRGA